MGTYYRIVILENIVSPINVDQLQMDIEKLLREINASLSTWEDNSLISQFNHDPTSINPFLIDDHFLYVMHAAQDVFLQSNGAFNPAVGPLVMLWGFDNQPYKDIPSNDELKNALENSDFKYIRLDYDQKTITRIHPGIILNFSAIAKGYAVDALAALLYNRGYKNYLVDIGGEIYGQGVNDQNNPWHTAIQNPEPNNLFASMFESEVIGLSNMGIATSGDYRNFYLINNILYNHIIDPRTGYPTQNGIASASVINHSTMIADAWATALMVIGRTGIEICNTMSIACMLILRSEEQKFEKIVSDKWLHYHVKLHHN